MYLALQKYCTIMYKLVVSCKNKNCANLRLEMMARRRKTVIGPPTLPVAQATTTTEHHSLTITPRKLVTRKVENSDGGASD